MADIVKKQDEQIPNSMQTRYKDMGDGTHAEVVYSGIAAGSAGAITIHQSRVDVGLASTSVIAANDSRKYLLLINDSDTEIYLTFGGAASLYSGVRLNAQGGSYEMSQVLGNKYNGAVTAIQGDTGTKRLLVNEGV